MSGLFDFNDLSDLPAPLQSKLAGGGRINPNIAIYANIVKAGSAAGVEALTARMIEAVAVRMELPALSENAMRTALNNAVTAGLIRKISRQTYGVLEATTSPTPPAEEPSEMNFPNAGEDVPETAPVADAGEKMPVDPLA